MARRKGSSGHAGRLYVPGIWSGVIRELRERESTSIHRFLDDPRQVLYMDGEEAARLQQRARSDAERASAERFEAGEPVTVEKAVLRARELRVPKDELLQILRDPELSRVRVHPDDTVEPVDAA